MNALSRGPPNNPQQSPISPFTLFPLILSELSTPPSVQCGSTCRNIPFHLASSDPPPPDYTSIAPPGTTLDKNRVVVSALHPRVAVLLGVHAHWHVPLLACRALSTAPAAWWGLRCALTFLGELLLHEDLGLPGEPWDAEKRFRVTEVFLAILWVCACLSGRERRGRRRRPRRPRRCRKKGTTADLGLTMGVMVQCFASAYLSFFFTDCLMSRWYVLLSRTRRCRY